MTSKDSIRAEQIETVCVYIIINPSFIYLENRSGDYTKVGNRIAKLNTATYNYFHSFYAFEH